MKFTSTTSEPVCMGSLIWSLGVTIFPSKLTRGELYAVRASGFKFSPLYRSGYIISTTLTLFTSYPPILSVTTRTSSWGWMIPILSLSEKPSTCGASFLALFYSKLLSSVDSRAIDITLEGREPVLLGAAKMTLIVPRGGLEEASL